MQWAHSRSGCNQPDVSVHLLSSFQIYFFLDERHSLSRARLAIKQVKRTAVRPATSTVAPLAPSRCVQGVLKMAVELLQAERERNAKASECNEEELTTQG